MLPQSADGAVPDSNVTSDREAPAAESASPNDRSVVTLLLTPSQTAPSQTAPSLQSPSQSSGSATPAPAAASVRYALLRGTAQFEMATAIPSRQAHSATPGATTAGGPVTSATPPKAQVGAGSLETQSTVEPEAAQAPARLTSDPTGAAPTSSKPLVANSVSAPAPLAAEPVPAKQVRDESIEAPTAQPGAAQTTMTLPVTAPETPGLRIRASAPAAEPSKELSIGSAKASVNDSVPIESSLPVKSSSGAVSPLQANSGDERTSKHASSPEVAIDAPLPMSDQPSDPTTTPAKTAQQPKPANAQVDRQSTSTDQSSIPVSAVSPVSKQPDPTLAAPMAPSITLPAPLPPDREVVDREQEASSPSVVQHEALPVGPAPKIPLLPEAENFAFAVRMIGPEVSPSHPSLANATPPITASDAPVSQPQASNPQQQPAPPGSQTSSGQQRETQSSAVETGKPDASNQNQPDLLKAQQTPGVTPHWNDSPVVQAPETGSFAGMPEPAEAAGPNPPIAAQETHSMAPELPRTSGSSEILLHLTGNDASSAAIRVADRAGSVNVSVHAADPVLRESLRSNLGELSNQLNAEGWKADVVKSAAVATHSESQQDSHAAGQRGSQQQQTSGGERQPQRDRRANGGQWQQELDQQTTGGDALPGGNG